MLLQVKYGNLEETICVNTAVPEPVLLRWPPTQRTSLHDEHQSQAGLAFGISGFFPPSPLVQEPSRTNPHLSRQIYHLSKLLYIDIWSWGYQLCSGLALHEKSTTSFNQTDHEEVILSGLFVMCEHGTLKLTISSPLLCAFDLGVNPTSCWNPLAEM
jgi:hypothetical protein